jgi:mannose/fructose/N-acetylgalactosamine-specific phosphotransferase system component IIC
MMPTTLHIALLGLWGGFLALERRAFLQAMLSRPLVAATVAGLALGDAETGVAIGVFFELWHLGGASLGAAHPEHETWSTLVSLGLAIGMGIASQADATPAMWGLAILLGAPSGFAGQWLENRLDTRAQKYAGRARAAVATGELDRAARQNVRAMWPPFLVSCFFSGASLLAGAALYAAESRVPLSLQRGLAWAFYAVTALSAGVAVFGTRAAHRNLIACIAAAGTAAVFLFQHRLPFR